MAKKASTKPEASDSPSHQVSKSPSLAVTEPTTEEINALVRQSHGGISRKMALRILTDRKEATAN